MRTTCSFSSLLLCLILVSCTSKTPTPTQIVNPKSTTQPPTQIIAPTSTTLPPTQTIIPTSTLKPTQTITPTSTDKVKMILPVLADTQVPRPQAAISSENTDQITELARWGGNTFVKAWAPDGSSFTVGTGSGIYVYDAATLEVINAIEPLDFSSIAYSPDGTILAISGGLDNAIMLWDIVGGSVVKTLSGQKGDIMDIAFSPNGEILAASGEQVTLWGISSGQKLHILSGAPAWEITFSPDGRLLATAETNHNKVELWDVVSGRELRTFTGDADFGSGIAFSPDGKILAVNLFSNRSADSSAESTIKLWEMTTGKEVQTINDATAISFLPDGHTMVIATGGRLSLWDITSGQLVRTLPITNLSCDELSPDGKTLLCFGDQGDGSWGNTIYLYDIATGKELGHLVYQTYDAFSLAFSPKGRLIASGFNSGQIKLLDADNGQEIRTLTGHTEPVVSLAFSPDGAMLASLSTDGTTRLWDVISGKQLHVIEGVKEFGWANWGYTSVDFSPNGKLLAFAGKRGQVRLWDISNHVEMQPIGEELDTNISGAVSAVAFSPDGKILASGYTVSGGFHAPYPITLWDLLNGQELRTLEYSSDQLPNQVSSLEFSPDGKMLAAGYWEGKITMWDIDSGSELYTWSFPWGQDIPDEISSLAFSTGGDVLAIGCENPHEIILLDAASGQELASLPGAAYVLAFSPDGKVLISSSYDGTIRVWGITP